MYPILFSFSTHFSTLFINNSSIQNILSQDNLSQNKILLIFCAACFAGYFIAYIKKRPTALFSIIGRGAAGLSFIYFFNFSRNRMRLILCTKKQRTLCPLQILCPYYRYIVIINLIMSNHGIVNNQNRCIVKLRFRNNYRHTLIAYIAKTF